MSRRVHTEAQKCRGLPETLIKITAPAARAADATAMALLLKVALLCAAAYAANTGGGSSNPDPLKNKDGSVYKEEFGRVHAQGVNMIQRASQLHDATYHRQGKTKATASCQRVALSEDARS